MKNDELFKDIVGQERPKDKMRFFLDSYLTTHIFPNSIITAPKGQGKTTLGRAVARGLYKFDENGKVEMAPDKLGKMKPKRKTFIEVNCSGIGNLDAFFNSLLIPNVIDKDVTILFDEASEIPHKVSMALLTILNPNPENRTVYAHKEYTGEFDFRRQTFLFATSEPQLVFHALIDRLERINLQEYTLDEMGQIVQRGAKEIEFKEDVLQDISPVLRGNARAAQKMADNIKAYLKGKTTFNKSDWEKLKKIFEIYPLGLSSQEIEILRHLQAHGEGMSLTALAARTGLTVDAVRKDYELYLQKRGLMTIEKTGRKITGEGLNYLRNLLNPPEKKATFRSSCIVP